MVFQVQFILLVSGIYSIAIQVVENCSKVYPLNHDDIQQYNMEIYHYLNNFENTKSLSILR